MLLLIDNFDSFTYNLVQSFQILDIPVRVYRNNGLTLSDCRKLNPSHLVIGPGPGNPSSSGISKEAIRLFAGQIPILGVCLGHQTIAELYGGTITRADKPMHGKVDRMYHSDKGCFSGLPQGFSATRYHSLLVERASLPECLEITASTGSGEIMGIRHKKLALEGVQFHPEAVMTEMGLTILQNFLLSSEFIDRDAVARDFI